MEHGIHNLHTYERIKKDTKQYISQSSIDIIPQYYQSRRNKVSTKFKGYADSEPVFPIVTSSTCDMFGEDSFDDRLHPDKKEYKDEYGFSNPSFELPPSLLNIQIARGNSPIPSHIIAGICDGDVLRDKVRSIEDLKAARSRAISVDPFSFPKAYDISPFRRYSATFSIGEYLHDDLIDDYRIHAERKQRRQQVYSILRKTGIFPPPKLSFSSSFDDYKYIKSFSISSYLKSLNIKPFLSSSPQRHQQALQEHSTLEFNLMSESPMSHFISYLPLKEVVDSLLHSSEASLGLSFSYAKDRDHHEEVSRDKCKELSYKSQYIYVTWSCLSPRLTMDHQDPRLTMDHQEKEEEKGEEKEEEKDEEKGEEKGEERYRAPIYL
ncbi:hypothetical protein ADUPG1_007042, partial [Aduncisulcus paluster]